MNKNMLILVIGLVALGGLAVATDTNLQKSLGWNSQSTETKSKKKATLNNAPNGTETAKIRRVVDGDTVELEDGRKVRLLNMDTPETVKPNTPVMCGGKEASEYSKKNLTDKNVILVADKEANDRYGRALRMVYFEGRDTTKPEQSYNAELVRMGHARVKSYSPNKTFEKPLLAIEQEAKTNKSGTWSCPEPFVK
jgi:micrococcal nuclease